MTILRHPSLPDVEPRVERFMTTFGVCAVDRERDLSIYGPELDDYEAAITAWNDWVRPLVELQAEVERRRDGMRHLEASRTELLGTVDAYMNAVERLTADLAAANARAERYRKAAIIGSNLAHERNCATVRRGGTECNCSIAAIRAALNHKPEQST